ncbi:MAG TPA: cytochrome c biogenesis protein CcsA [Gemmatimonadaceae bacterium]|nr:cytochrome c biogenesis protein CcsA [Gemmatimonadaceae bacterium]
MILVGELALWVALLMAAWGAIVSFAGGRLGRTDLIASGERALYAAFACLVLASAGLLVALVTSDFSVEYVASVTSANLPLGYKVAALWAGRAGGMLSWTLLVSVCAAIAVAGNQARNRSATPYVSAMLSVVLLFFLAMLCFDVNPYARLVPIPVEGRGMHPDLQHPAMTVHPPTLYLGYAAAAIPLAFTIAALATRNLDDDATLAVRRWATVSWLFITMGIGSGMWWTYVNAGAGTAWLRDPIERSSLFPWLAASAFLYFAMRRRGRPDVASGDVVGMRTRAGRYTLYVGIVVFIIASAGFTFRKEREVTLAPGEATTLVDPYRREWTFTSQGVSDFPELNRAVEAVPLRATRDGAPAGFIVSERREYVDSRGLATFEPSLEPGIDYALLQTTYVVLTNIAQDRVSLRIAFHPLMIWVWIGGIAIAIGGTMVSWPVRLVRRGEPS